MPPKCRAGERISEPDGARRARGAEIRVMSGHPSHERASESGAGEPISKLSPPAGRGARGAEIRVRSGHPSQEQASESGAGI